MLNFTKLFTCAEYIFIMSYSTTWDVFKHVFLLLLACGCYVKFTTHIREHTYTYTNQTYTQLTETICY